MIDVDLRHPEDILAGDQGRRPLCVPFAVTAIHEYMRRQALGKGIQLAPEPIWSAAVAVGQASEAGMVPGAAALCLHSSGQPHLATWPYNPDLGADTEPTPSDAGPPPWFSAHIETSDFNGSFEESLRSALAQGRPAVGILRITPEFYLPQNGIVNSPAAGFDQYYGLHAVACLGITANTEAAGPLVLVKNSWGDGWGRAGWAHVPVTYFESWTASVSIDIASMSS